MLPPNHNNIINYHSLKIYHCYNTIIEFIVLIQVFATCLSNLFDSLFFFLFFCFLGPHLHYMEVPQAPGVGWEPQLPPQLMAMPDPRPTEQGQRSNLHPHGYESG